MLLPPCPDTALDMPAYAQAVDLAAAAHSGQTTTIGEPYILHPIRVAVAITADGFSLPFRITAVLHDVVEDTPLDLKHIRCWFGDELAGAVQAVTKIDGESYEEFIARAEAHPVGRWVKLYDLNDNYGRLDELIPTHADMAARLRERYGKALAYLAQRGVLR